MNRDLEAWAQAWERVARRAGKRWMPVVRWAFSYTGGAMPRHKSAALRLARLAIDAEASTVQLRHWLRMRPPALP
jgi:hypothetical protein